MNPGQKLALQQLEEIAHNSGGALEIVEIKKPELPTLPAEISISLDCREFQKTASGLPLRARERVRISVPKDFPFQSPSTYLVHTRYAGYPHVQWGCCLCLYQAPGTEWIPSDGMYGYIDRLRLFFEKGAEGELNPTNEPLHPPVAYQRTGGLQTIVPLVNTPVVEDAPWKGYAVLRRLSEKALEVVSWTEEPSLAEGQILAPAILLNSEMPFEFPSKISGLTNALKTRGVEFGDLFVPMLRVSIRNAEDSPLFFLVGTPMRGIAGGRRAQHLTAWFVPAATAAELRKIMASENGSPEEVASFKEIASWFEKEPIEWCSVREDRPEVTSRRDSGSELMWFKDRRVALWGCGALGSQLAEMLARVGVASLILRDSGKVAPGLIVRQNFRRADIGQYKVDALKARLQEINPQLVVESYHDDIKDGLTSEAEVDEVDVIIESTGSISVLDKIELARRTTALNKVPLISLAVGHDSKRGILVYAPAGYTGGPKDLYRKTKLATACNAGLTAFANEFWPVPSRDKIFQPEPGCSEPTFSGSISDSLSLVACLINFAAEQVQTGPEVAATCLLDMSRLSADIDQRVATLKWDADVVCSDSNKGFEVRVSPQAWKSIRACIAKSARSRSPRVETGGALLGETDEATGVVWITEATDPPHDSVCSEKEFTCGVRGLRELAQKRAKESKGSSVFVGMWHTHPRDYPIPSVTDLSGMRKVVDQNATTPRLSLMMIVGGKPFPESLAAFVFRRADTDFEQNPDRIFVIQPRLDGEGVSQQKTGWYGKFSGLIARALPWHRTKSPQESGEDTKA